MKSIEVRNTTQSLEETAGPSKLSKSQSLRLDKQIIRTLTGAELKLVGGGKLLVCDCSCGCHTNNNN